MFFSALKKRVCVSVYYLKKMVRREGKFDFRCLIIFNFFDLDYKKMEDFHNILLFQDALEELAQVSHKNVFLH